MNLMKWLRWDNFWINSEFLFAPEGRNKIRASGADVQQTVTVSLRKRHRSFPANAELRPLSTVHRYGQKFLPDLKLQERRKKNLRWREMRDFGRYEGRETLASLFTEKVLDTEGKMKRSGDNCYSDPRMQLRHHWHSRYVWGICRARGLAVRRNSGTGAASSCGPRIATTGWVSTPRSAGRTPPAAAGRRTSWRHCPMSSRVCYELGP